MKTQKVKKKENKKIYEHSLSLLLVVKRKVQE